MIDAELPLTSDNKYFKQKPLRVRRLNLELQEKYKRYNKNEFECRVCGSKNGLFLDCDGGVVCSKCSRDYVLVGDLIKFLTRYDPNVLVKLLYYEHKEQNIAYDIVLREERREKKYNTLFIKIKKINGVFNGDETTVQYHTSFDTRQTDEKRMKEISKVRLRGDEGIE